MTTSGKITVEIIHTTANIGKQGEIKEVSLTYAQNKLFPEGIAKEYKPQPSKDEKRAKIYVNRFEITKRLHEKTLIVHMTHEQGKLSEAINQDWVVAKIREKFHIALLPETIRLDEKTIKKAGKYTIHLDLAPDAYAQMVLELH
ncbi:MAG: 50S ribosomal L9 C-terminal domain-containing protein [Candidatus Gracilibacteria bacterium]|jgi:ribosomal protein L9